MHEHENTYTFSVRKVPVLVRVHKINNKHKASCSMETHFHVKIMRTKCRTMQHKKNRENIQNNSSAIFESAEHLSSCPHPKNNSHMKCSTNLVL